MNLRLRRLLCNQFMSGSRFFSRLLLRLDLVDEGHVLRLQRLAQHRGDGHRVIRRVKDATHARGDVIVDQRDLVVDIGLCGPVGGGLHAVEFDPAFVDEILHDL